jgi:hypothetical protein
MRRSGRTYVGKGGYKRFKNSGKLVHRYVAEKKLGRKLKRDEVVHHKNHNNQDNTPANLVVYPSQSVHMKKAHRLKS